MTVKKAYRRESTFEVQTKCDELLLYVLEITANGKTFDFRYRELTRRIVDTAFGIAFDAYEANDVRVNSREDWERRKGLQTEAISGCKMLTYMITLSAKAFHLEARRVEYWTGLTLDVEAHLRKWRESDARRFSGI